MRLTLSKEMLREFRSQPSFSTSCKFSTGECAGFRPRRTGRGAGGGAAVVNALGPTFTISQNKLGSR